MVEATNDTFLSPAEIADQLKIEPSTVHDWLRKKKIRGTKLGKVWRVRKSDFEEFVNNGYTSTTDKVA